MSKVIQPAADPGLLSKTLGFLSWGSGPANGPLTTDSSLGTILAKDPFGPRWAHVEKENQSAPRLYVLWEKHRL